MQVSLCPVTAKRVKLTFLLRSLLTIRRLVSGSMGGVVKIISILLKHEGGNDESWLHLVDG